MTPRTPTLEIGDLIGHKTNNYFLFLSLVRTTEYGY